MNRISNWLLSSVLALVITFSAAPAMAQELDTETDARLEGYNPTQVKVEGDSTALIWLLMLFLAAVGLAPLLKDAKRSHLD